MWRLGTRVTALVIVAAYMAAYLTRASSRRRGDSRRPPGPDAPGPAPAPAPGEAGVADEAPTFQTALQAAARELGSASEVGEAVRLMAEHAVASTNALGAYVERIGDPYTRGEVEVIAVAGRGHPPLGTRIPYPGSLSEEIIESGEPQLMTEVGAIGERMAPYLEESCRLCSGLVVPLSTGDKVLGALVVLRGPGTGLFTDDEAELVRTLGDLEIAAFQRLRLIERLRESEERFRQIVDHLDQVIWLGAPDISVRYYVNPAYEKVWGRSRESFYEHPRSPIEALHPEDRDRVEAALIELRHGREYDIQYRIIRPDGELRWIWSRGYPIRNALGEVYRVAGIMEDITDQKEIETERERLLGEAQRSRDEVTNIMESITDAFFTLDRDWRFTYINHQAELLLGRPRDELLHKNVWEKFPEAVGSIFEREYRGAMAGDRTAAFEAYYEPIGRWLDVRAYPSARGLSVYFRDISGRKHVEEELQSRILQLDALATLGQSALVETDLDRLFDTAVDVAARGVGADLSELLELLPSGTDLLLRAGIGWREGLVGSATTSADRESMAGYTLLSAEPVIVEDLGMETRFRGSWFLREHGAVSGLSVVVMGPEHPWGALAAHTRARRRFSGDDIFFFQSVANILGQAIELRRVEAERMRLLEAEREARTESEKARAEADRRREELERVTESRSRLMRGFSHDVKNPLGAADGFLQLLEEGILDNLTERQRDGVERARRAIRDALDLIEDLLTIAHAEAGTIMIEREPTDLLATLRAATESVQPRAATKRLELEALLPGELPMIDSDPDRIRQVLGNLLSNAVKYTEHGGITVTAELREGEAERGRGEAPGPGRWIAIGITDTGPGIPEEQQRIIFREFGRLESEKGKEGQGIGLFIARRIAQALGGEITVRSEVGRGSTFTLWLPAGGDMAGT